MKRIFLLLLSVLLLCGCVSQSPKETDFTTDPALPAVEPTEPAGSYDPEHPLEAATGGAVRVYLPEIPEGYAVAMMGKDPVIFSGRENTTLTRLTGENLYVTAEVTLGERIHPDMPSVLVTERGIFYYDRENHALVQLGTGLKEIGREQLPEDLVGEPVVSGDRKRVYYCTEHFAWELTLETGISRMIKEVSESFTTAVNLLMEDTVLGCRTEGGEQLFLSVDNGKTLWQGREDITVTGAGQNWLAVVPEGIVNACVFGTGDAAPRMLLPEQFDGLWHLANLGLLVEVSGGADAAVLDCYQLEEGTRSATLKLEESPRYLTADDSRVWILTKSLLCGWDPAAMPSGDETVYATPRYTLENPDAEGYARCEVYAREIGERHDVEILFGAAAVEQQPREYDLTGEYMVPVLLGELEKLDTLLSLYPEDMLEDAVEETTDGTLYICLVRRVEGSPELGIPGTVGGTQFWNGSDCYVALAVGQEISEWYRPMYHALEPRLMSNSKACYDWEYLNPEGFDYDYNYILNQNRRDEGWLEGENRYFIDLFSMSFPREDRARIMEYAMMEGCGDYFVSPAMQAKLKALCVGLREAYGLKKSPETFLWEQYLAEPLAYSK